MVRGGQLTHTLAYAFRKTAIDEVSIAVVDGPDVSDDALFPLHGDDFDALRAALICDIEEAAAGADSFGPPGQVGDACFGEVELARHLEPVIVASSVEPLIAEEPLALPKLTPTD